MPLVFGFSVYPPCETSLKSCNLFYCPSIEAGSRRTLLRPFRLDGGHLSYTCLLSQQNVPTNLQIQLLLLHTSARPLIAILLQFLNIAPLPLITGKIPDSTICSTLVFFSVSVNSLYLFTILVVPSLSALFVPTYTSIDPPWPCPNTFSTRSVTCSILPPERQTTTYSPLLNVLSVFCKMESPINTLSVLNAPSITASE